MIVPVDQLNDHPLWCITMSQVHNGNIITAHINDINITMPYMAPGKPNCLYIYYSRGDARPTTEHRWTSFEMRISTGWAVNMKQLLTWSCGTQNAQVGGLHCDHATMVSLSQPWKIFPISLRLSNSHGFPTFQVFLQPPATRIICSRGRIDQFWWICTRQNLDDIRISHPSCHLQGNVASAQQATQQVEPHC